jgi:hypothetical protein
MTKRNPDERLERFNVVLSLDDIAWLDHLAAEIQAGNGGKVSRSEIIRAAVATLKELHRCVPQCAPGLVPLADCKRGAELMMAGILAVRLAATGS